MSDLTFQDIYDYVSEIHAAEDGRPSRKMYMLLANRALALMSEMSGSALVTLTVDDDNISVVDGVVTLPNNVVSVNSITADGHTIYSEHKEGCAPCYPFIETKFGKTGKTLSLPEFVKDANAITVEAWVTIGQFSDAEDSVNPLRYVPEAYQLLPAYYVLSELPAGMVNTARPISDRPIASYVSPSVARKEEYLLRWSDGLQSFSWAMKKLKYEKYSF